MKQTNPNSAVSLEEVLIALEAMGEDVSASRVEAVWSRVGALNGANVNREVAIHVAVESARRAVDSGAPTSAEPLPTREQFEERITEQITRCHRLLQEAVVLPKGHKWYVESNQLTFGSGPIESVAYGASFSIVKQWAPTDPLRGPADPEQVSSEIRVFLPEQRYLSRGKEREFRKHSGPQFSAILWVNSGLQWAGQSTDHMHEKNRYPKGNSVEDLVSAIAQTINPILEEAAKAVEAAKAGPAEESLVGGTSLPEPEEAETQYSVSIYCERRTHADSEAGDSGPTECQIDHETVDRDELERLGRDHGINEASCSHLSLHGAQRIWFSSTSPDADREYFEQGVEKYYSLHIHAVDGKEPSTDQVKDVAALLGVRIADPRPTVPDSGPSM